MPWRYSPHHATISSARQCTASWTNCDTCLSKLASSNYHAWHRLTKMYSCQNFITRAIFCAPPNDTDGWKVGERENNLSPRTAAVQIDKSISLKAEPQNSHCLWFTFGDHSNKDFPSARRMDWIRAGGQWGKRSVTKKAMLNCVACPSKYMVMNNRATVQYNEAAHCAQSNQRELLCQLAEPVLSSHSSSPREMMTPYGRET